MIGKYFCCEGFSLRIRLIKNRLRKIRRRRMRQTETFFRGGHGRGGSVIYPGAAKAELSLPLKVVVAELDWYCHRHTGIFTADNASFISRGC